MSPQSTTISPGKNIVETQCHQELELAGSNTDDDSLNPSSVIVEVKSPPSIAISNGSNDSVSSMDSYSVTYSVEGNVETPSSENSQVMDCAVESSPQKSDSVKMALHELKETSVNKDEVFNPLVSNLAEVGMKEELVVEVKAVDQNSVHRRSNEGESLETVIEVQVSNRSPDILMSDRTENSVEELLRDLKLEDSKDTSTFSTRDGDSEPAGGARQRIVPSLQQVTVSAEGASVSVRT